MEHNMNLTMYFSHFVTPAISLTINNASQSYLYFLKFCN